MRATAATREIRRLSQGLSRLVTALAVLLSALLLLERFSDATIQLLRLGPDAQRWCHLGNEAALAIPETF